MFPDWPGDEAAREHDFAPKDEEGKDIEFTDETSIYLPPSFHEFEKDDIQWLRPREFLREVAIERELLRMKDEGRTLFKKKSTFSTSSKHMRRRHTAVISDTASEMSDGASEAGDATSTAEGNRLRRRKLPKEVLDNL